MGVDGKIQALNQAIREAIPHMREVADENPQAQVLVRAVRFSDVASWHMPDPVPVEQFGWKDLEAGGTTAMGEALKLVADQLRIPPMAERALPPVLVLISDGQPTDDFEGGLRALLDLPWGKKAVRIAIAIGEDADREVLARFVNNPEIPVLQANNPEALKKHIRWVSTVVVRTTSSPPSQVGGGASSATNVPIPQPVSGPDDAKKVW